MDESSDLQWRQGWLAVGLPPSPVLAVSAIVTFFLYLTWQMDEYEEQLRRRTLAGLWVLLVLGAVALVLLGSHALVDGGGRIAVPVSWRWGGDGGSTEDGGAGGTSPWAVMAVLTLLLVLASHKSSFQMFRPPWQ
ncbi:hypothetical protein E2562_019602 [Oryza meyeriana var. granulata]|uniref:Uncharacterized protein n=1 Tax=Oryza meyeriana var. granulata TaxID=110450 RepID=A0A6G1EXA4_9ORYZ|nr:hypothetical protein E2562_019602 [Oryza meyeriana var. granulata]